ncbi:MAG: hypothetical protein H7336_16805 [Bacteriovorax sp.]|nr:hypothetical protein [Bacteriovorax sp.]
MTETIRLILTKFTDETITVFSLLLLVTMVGIIIYWFYNRKKFHQLSHEIPASVVKNYLDSIIQNSNSLKSSLFRGGGLDIGNGIPSVVPVGDLPASMSIGLGTGEESNQKNAEISALNQRLTDRQRQIADLERTIQELSAGKGLGAETELLKKDLSTSQQKVRDLESQLAEAMTRAGGDTGLQKELASVTSERNEIRERLKEYAIIEEDLANLKRLQQENDQLKAELLALRRGAQSATPVAPVPVVAAKADPVEDDMEAAMAQAIADSRPAPKAPQAVDVPLEDVPVEEGEQKSAEELLSEFEKMLG